MASAPKICQLITRLILGGAQRLALETACHLQARGWPTELWCGPQTGPEGSLHEEARRRGMTVRVVPELRRELDPRRDLLAAHRLQRLFEAAAFDVVHTHSSKAGIIGRRAAAAAGVPIRLHTVHGWGMTPATPAALNGLFSWLERRAAAQTRALIAVSASVRDAGLERGIGRPDQYAVIHGGIPIPPPTSAEQRAAARDRLGIPPSAVVAGTIGRLDDAKDPLGALRAALPVLRGRPELRLVFIGDGRLRGALERAVRRSGAAPRILLAGRQADAAVLARAFDIFILSSRWEGFPLAVVEAMAIGLPVVAYDVGGIREALEDGRTGFLAPSGDAAAWGRHLDRLAGSSALRVEMGAAGRQAAERRFSLARMLAATEKLYEALLAGNRSPLPAARGPALRG